MYCSLRQVDNNSRTENSRLALCAKLTYSLLWFGTSIAIPASNFIHIHPHPHTLSPCSEKETGIRWGDDRSGVKEPSEYAVTTSWCVRNFHLCFEILCTSFHYSTSSLSPSLFSPSPSPLHLPYPLTFPSPPLPSAVHFSLFPPSLTGGSGPHPGGGYILGGSDIPGEERRFSNVTCVLLWEQHFSTCFVLRCTG